MKNWPNSHVMQSAIVKRSYIGEKKYRLYDMLRNKYKNKKITLIELIEEVEKINDKKLEDIE